MMKMMTRLYDNGDNDNDDECIINANLYLAVVLTLFWKLRYREIKHKSSNL